MAIWRTNDLKGYLCRIMLANMNTSSLKEDQWTWTGHGQG